MRSIFSGNLSIPKTSITILVLKIPFCDIPEIALSFRSYLLTKSGVSPQLNHFVIIGRLWLSRLSDHVT